MYMYVYTYMSSCITYNNKTSISLRQREDVVFAGLPPHIYVCARKYVLIHIYVYVDVYLVHYYVMRCNAGCVDVCSFVFVTARGVCVCVCVCACARVCAGVCVCVCVWVGGGLFCLAHVCFFFQGESLRGKSRKVGTWKQDAVCQ